MRLKSVELFGFKSFPDKTVIAFDDGITAVLGPNGCGKSNVVDAIKWVLGEKSAKNLRGDEMLDVIFSGCATRHASGMAEVKLNFDNTDGSIPLPYNEVCLSRRLYRSKESHYFINQNRCRLKEIRDILLDGGIGTSGYSVIEQGRVEALLHAKPAERRAVFEEAAGIAKFKIRRKEILARLDRGEHILARVADRVEEKERQIKKVATQAANARRHRRLSEERDAVRRHLYLRQFAAQSRLLTDLAAKREALQGELDRENRTLTALGEEFTRASAREAALSRDRDDVTDAAGKTQEELSGIQLRAANAKNRIDSIAAELGRGRERRQELTSRLERLTRQEEEARKTLAEAGTTARELEERVGQQDGERQTLARAVADIEAEVTVLRNSIIDKNRRRRDMTAEAARLEEAEAAAAERKAEAETQLVRLAGEEEETRRSVAGLEAEYNAAAADFGKHADRLDGVRTALREATARGEELLKSERALESERAGKESRKATLEDLERSFDGAFEGVRNILSASREGRDGCRGVVGMAVDLMSVPQDLALAVETILGGQAQDVVVETARDAQSCIEHLKKNRLGRATFLPLDRIQPRRRLQQSLRHIPGVLGEAVELVSFDRRFAAVMEYLLAGTLVVDNLSLARELSSREARGVRIVTLEGDVVNPSGAMTGGHGRQQRTGLVQRKAELDRLIGEVAECARRLAEQTALRRETTEKAAALSREAQELEGMMALAGRSEAGLKQTLLARRGDLERLVNSRTELSARRDSLVAGGKAGVLEELRGGLVRTEEELAALETAIEAKTADQRAARDSIDRLGQDFAALTGERSAALARVRELETRIAEFAQEADVAREELASPGLGAAEGEAEIAQLRLGLAEFAAREEMLLRLRDERRATAVELSEKVTECRSQLEALRLHEHECQGQLSRLQEGLSDVSRQTAEGEMRLAGIRERAREEVQLEEFAVTAEADGGIAAPAAPAAGAEEENRPEWLDNSDEELQARIQDLSQKIRNIGNVNPEAIDELAELEASAEFLRSHKEEQEEAAQSMRAAIDRLNEESSTRFQDTFTRVRANFQDMFTRLFGGGKADLFLEQVTEPGADPLDAGIDIQAQPPGKEPKSISLLSGGEKALCAVALLFALFRSKPSPFCILDEVDGPLDESNITRFMQLVRDFTTDTQFIIITHSQLTMGMMDSIWGVTQQERGISKVMSLKYAKMEDMAEGITGGSREEENVAATA